MTKPRLVTPDSKKLDIARALSSQAPNSRREALALATFASLVAEGDQDYILPYSYVDLNTGLRYRSEGNMDLIHATVESTEGIKLREQVNEVLGSELGAQAVHGHDCNDCIMPIGEEPSDLWLADQDLRSRSARLAPTVLLPSFEQVAEIAKVPTEMARRDEEFFESIASLATELQPKGSSELAA